MIPLLLFSVTEIHKVIEAGLDEFTDYERPERTCTCIGCSMGMHSDEHEGEPQMCDITRGAENGEKAHHCTMSENHGNGENPSVCSCSTKSKKTPHILYNTPDKNALIAFMQPAHPKMKEIHFRDYFDYGLEHIQNDIFHPPRA
jgi:hypothetical protein